MKVILFALCFLLVSCSAVSHDLSHSTSKSKVADKEEEFKKEKYSRARLTSVAPKQLPPAVIEANRSAASHSGGSHSVYFSRFPKVD